MRASIKGREELAESVQVTLALSTKKEAEHVVNSVIWSIETTLLNNLETNGFTLKLNGLGKFSVMHKSGTLKKVGFTGKTIQTNMRRKIRFTSLGALRRRERLNS
jgi:nucleoid DNA-binding protein